MIATPASIRIPAYAKINLSLRILGRRDDGFHALETRMVPIDVSDEVEIARLRGGESSLTCSDESLPLDDSNLAMKALRAFEKRTGVSGAWGIHLEKMIPSGAGLGGGSSDAAAVLRGLNDLTGCRLPLETLAELGAAIGSDVPFFLHGRACDATGRGEIVSPVEFPHQLTLVLIKPPFGVSTPWAYQRWAASRPLAEVSYEAQVCPWGEMVNDLERPVFEKHLLLPAIKMWLLAQDETQAALMSGSGSTVFAIVREGAQADALAARAQAWCGPTCWVRVARTMHR